MLNNFPTFREQMLKITSSKFTGNIDPRAELDNILTKELIAIRNIRIDLAESGLLEEELKDIWAQELLTK